MRTAVIRLAMASARLGGFDRPIVADLAKTGVTSQPYGATHSELSRQDEWREAS